MSKVKNFFVAAALFPMALGAQNLISNADGEADLKNWDKKQVQLVSEGAHSGNGCFKTLNTRVIGTEIVPIDESKTYKISGWFKSADDKKTYLYLGLMPLDENKKQIMASSVNVVAGSETELAAPCEAKDTVIKLKDASKWPTIKDKFSHIAFEADASKKYSDLPNSKVSSPIVSIVQKDGVWEVTLSKPCGKAYPANTVVREQRDGSVYMYPVFVKDFQSQEWKELSAQIKGIAKSGCAAKQFWKGTKYVKVIILAANGGMIYFDDLKLEEVN